MKTPVRIFIVAALVLAVIAAVTLKRIKTPETTAGASPPVAALSAAGNDAAGRLSQGPGPATAAKLPKLVDLGADKCIPCKMMKPILEELKRDYADRFITEFIDVWKNPEAGRRYGIQMIPTQIFYDAEGKELFRHVGFMGKKDILAKWKELGVDLK